MDHQLLLKFEFGNAPKILLQNGGFDLKLMLVVGMLIMAATTALKIRAWRWAATWRTLHNLINSRTGKA